MTTLDQTATAKKQAKSGVMRAAVITTPGQTALTEVEIPGPKAGEVRVKIQGCGVCASNLELWAGQPWFEYPFPPGAPGHEGWGIVEKCGAEVSNVTVGDRVAMLSNRAYAEYDVADADSVLKLPESLKDSDVPAEPLGCAMNIFRRSDIQAGQTVAIVGVGFLGALVTQLAKNAGARVIAITRRPFALEIAREFGADETIQMNDYYKNIEQVKNLTAGAGCERVIEAAGKQYPLDLATELTKERGKLIIAGYHQDGARQVNMQLWNWRGLDVINAHERDPKVYLEGMRLAIEAIEKGELNPEPLYTHRFGLDELGKALDMTRERPEGFLKALIKL